MKNWVLHFQEYNGSELKTNEAIGLINQMAEYRPRIYLGGAEPFIREDLLSIELSENLFN